MYTWLEVGTKGKEVRELVLPAGSSQWNRDTQELSLWLGGSAHTSLLLAGHGGLPALHASQACCSVRLERHRAQGHQSPAAVHRGLAIAASPGEPCPGWGSRLHGCDDDGWPRESIFHLQVAHVCILTLGQALTGMSAVLCFLSCCHLFPFTDKWTHFTA